LPGWLATAGGLTNKSPFLWVGLHGQRLEDFLNARQMLRQARTAFATGFVEPAELISTRSAGAPSFSEEAHSFPEPTYALCQHPNAPARRF